MDLLRSNADLDAFATGIAHDLRAPLRAIFGLLEKAEGELGEGDLESLAGSLQATKPRVARLFGLIEEVLRLAELNVQRPVAPAVDPTALVHEVLGRLSLPPGFHARVQPGMPVVGANRVQLGLVFQNLLDNAVKHHDRASGKVEVTATARGPWVDFLVTDDGPGTGPSVDFGTDSNGLSRRPPPSPFGLGLALVRRAVEARGGFLEVVGGAERGMSVLFSWPKEGEQGPPRGGSPEHVRVVPSMK
ncbi:MAG: sensor histidine kinase [Thermoplasmatota archaeon]